MILFSAMFSRRWAKAFNFFLALSLLVLPHLAAQSSADVKIRPSFEVATIKHTAPKEQGGGVWSPPGIGRYWAKSVSLEFLIQTAFNVDPNNIAGKPPWINSDYFDVEAKPEGGIALTRDELRPRLQDLLNTRFHLASHYETRMEPGYAMVVFKSGPKLQPTAGQRPPGFRVYVGPGRLEGTNWSMAYLASMLERPAGRPVLDETGIDGSYDIKVEYAHDIEADSSLPSLFTALRETLGLELKAKKIPVHVLVIDRVDRVPTAN